MGIRYLRMLPSADLQSLPPAARALAYASRAHFVNQDRGIVRSHNDSTHDSRAIYFGGWLERIGFNEHTLRQLKPELFADILGAYLDSIKAGHNLTNLLNPAPETQRQYVDAATSVITLYTQVPCSTIDISTIAAKRPTTIPYIGLRLADTAA